MSDQVGNPEDRFSGIAPPLIFTYFSEQSIQYRSKSMTSQDLTDAPDTYADEKKIDAFISYRRANGAQLARWVVCSLWLNFLNVLNVL